MIGEITSFKKKIFIDLKSISSKGFIFIVFVGILLRIIAFDMHNTLHIDEAIYGNWGATIGHSGKIFFSVAEADKPPLFYYILGASIFLFGPNDSAIKIPGLIIGILMILLTALLAKNLSNPKSAFWAALFYATSPFEISYAPTAFAELTCVLFCLLVILAIQYRLPFLTGLFIGLAFAVKQTVIYFLPVYAIFYLMKFHDSRKLFIDDLKMLGLGLITVFIPLFLWAFLLSGKGMGIFFAVFRKDYISGSLSEFNFIKWLSLEKFVTGNYFTLYFSLIVIALARILYMKDLLRVMNKKTFGTVMELITLILFIFVYYLMISVTGYPVYSRYLLVITSLYLTVFGVSFEAVLTRISEFIKYDRINRFIPVISFAIIAIWILKAPYELQKFPDASNYTYHEAVKPCLTFIKNKLQKSAVYYTDEIWPWAPWYLFAEKQKKRIFRTPVDFKSIEGVQTMIEKMTGDLKKLRKRKIYFVLNETDDTQVFSYIKRLTGLVAQYEKLFVSQPANESYPSYSVYQVKLESVIPD